jgi:hypothetical protein
MDTNKAYRLIDKRIRVRTGLSLADLPDTATLANWIDTIAELKSGDSMAGVLASEAAQDIIEEEINEFA